MCEFRVIKIQDKIFQKLRKEKKKKVKVSCSLTGMILYAWKEYVYTDPISYRSTWTINGYLYTSIWCARSHVSWFSGLAEGFSVLIDTFSQCFVYILFYNLSFLFRCLCIDIKTQYRLTLIKKFGFFYGKIYAIKNWFHI